MAQIIDLRFNTKDADDWKPGNVTENFRALLQRILDSNPTVFMSGDGSLYPPMGGNYGHVTTLDTIVFMAKGDQRAYAFGRADGTIAFSPSRDKATRMAPEAAKELMEALRRTATDATIAYGTLRDA
jgi:hypothetical protein